MTPQADVAETARKFYELMASPGLHAQLPHPDERRPGAGAVLRLLRAARWTTAIDSIFDAIKHTALIHKSGGGTGFSFSRIRPENDRVLSTKGVASGPISFMNIFDVATETIKQGGTRRGANMGILRIDHPDIEDFITCKKRHQAPHQLQHLRGRHRRLHGGRRGTGGLSPDQPPHRQEVKQVKASALFDLIVKSAWATGEPGIIFLDAINRANPCPTWGTSKPPTPAASSPCCPTSPATWAPSTWPRW